MRSSLAHYVRIVPVALALALASPAFAQPGDFTKPVEEPSAQRPPFEPSAQGDEPWQARLRYDAGARLLRRAEKLEERAAAEPDDERRRALGDDARAAREAAVPELARAIGGLPAFLPAYLALADDLRRLGRPAAALAVDRAALRQAPDDTDVFASWTASSLALDMIGDVVAFHASFAEDDPRRAVAVTALRDYLAARRATPGTFPADALDRLETWLAEREGGEE